MKDHERMSASSETRFHVHIIIPSNCTSMLLGNGGANIRRLAHNSFVHLTIRPRGDSPHPDDRLLVISGFTRNVFRAIRDIIADIQAHTGCNTTTNVGPLVGDEGSTYVLVPSVFATLMMLKGGEKLKEIAHATGARFQLSPVEDMPLGTTLRRLYVHGPEPATRKAVAQVMHKLAEFNQLPSDKKEDELTLKTVFPESAMEYLEMPTLKFIMRQHGTTIKIFPIGKSSECIVTISGTLSRILATEDNILHLLDMNRVSMVYLHKQLLHGRPTQLPLKRPLSPPMANQCASLSGDTLDRRNRDDWGGRVVQFQATPFSASKSPPSSANVTKAPYREVFRGENHTKRPRPDDADIVASHRKVRLVQTNYDSNTVSPALLNIPSNGKRVNPGLDLNAPLPTPRNNDPARTVVLAQQTEAPRTVRQVTTSLSATSKDGTIVLSTQSSSDKSNRGPVALLQWTHGLELRQHRHLHPAAHDFKECRLQPA
ncbi:hypothetical protein DYB32_003627 [Aphanomyces invadans]|uniref:K Homology domain-containing protein n=1 Tax=Aphanomyces invadans TaxID=157072 RepID=A0A3R6VZB2_9STRA|nr:hypothetical protein DYB32_003627 [Aphanomyces invadans]